MLEKRKTALKEALTDNDPQVREAASTSLDKLEGLAELPQLIAQLSSGERGSRIAAAYALGRLNSNKIFVPLLEALNADDPDLRTAVVRVLGDKHHPKTLAPLVKAIKDPEIGVVTEVAFALGKFDDQRLPKVLESLIGREEQVALAAIESLTRLDFPEGEEALLTALADPRPALRIKAAMALGNLTPTTTP